MSLTQTFLLVFDCILIAMVSQSQLGLVSVLLPIIPNHDNILLSNFRDVGKAVAQAKQEFRIHLVLTKSTISVYNPHFGVLPLFD